MAARMYKFFLTIGVLLYSECFHFQEKVTGVRDVLNYRYHVL